ncbi:UNVERIFIED_CONTAM: hypothetical protein PYX00_004500 [Menopon gallinae]|uniref:RING-type domain-containing protein n=1 Tax=Menopon gallinae TaxID=328185 RepID=A0AAW2I5Y1_9NEOP
MNMMHICCVICKEFFLPTSEMCVTKCGHFYHHQCIDKWRDRSGSCPQCRRKLTEKPVKAYIDFGDSSDAKNIWDLKVKIDNLRESIDNMRKKNEQADTSIEKLKQNLEDHLSKNNILKDRIKPLNEKVKGLVDVVEALKPLCEKNKLFKARIESMKNLHVILQGSENEIKSLLSKTQISPLAVNKLSFYVVALQEKLDNNKKVYQKEISVLQEEYDRIHRKLKEEKSKESEVVPEIHFYKGEVISKVNEIQSTSMDENSWSFPGANKKKVVVVNLREKTTKKKDLKSDAVVDDGGGGGGGGDGVDDDDDFDDTAFVIPTIHPHKKRLLNLGPSGLNVKENRSSQFKDGGCSGVSASLSATWGPIRSVLSTPFEERNLSKPSGRKGLPKCSINDRKPKKSSADTKTLYSYFPRRS